MNIINVENITKSFTERKLFSKASFYVQEHEKIGIVGINGTGKSTLLKIVAGMEEPEEGSVIRANHIIINYLPQNPQFDPAQGALDAVMEEIMKGESDDTMRWTLESDAKSLMTRLQLLDYQQPTGELSGGQKKRLALVAAVVKHCDVLILDEPTNHLDYDMVEWLEAYLKAFKGAILMVTHDRYFLDSVCNRIVEIDKGAIYSYDDNYSGFLEKKAARYENARTSEQKRQNILRKEIAWMQRGARARSTKQKAHIQRYEALRDQKGPDIDAKLELSSINSRMGRTTIELNAISKAYGDKTLVKDFTYIFLKNDRVGFVGVNGCGKTTLMKMIAGVLTPDSGSIEVGQTIKIGYYTQEIKWLDPNQRVIDFIRDTAEYVRTEDGLVSASGMLERFLFPPEEQYSAIGKLSGGEKRRLNLLRVLMEAPNVLILDEPTNDLDTETMAILEDYLDSFAGIIITVSHDRYFLDRIVRRIFSFDGDGRLTQHEGGYTDYMTEMGDGGTIPRYSGKFTDNLFSEGGNAKNTKSSKGAAGGAVSTSSGSASGSVAGQARSDSQNRSNGRNPNRKLKFTYKEQKEYETIEDDLVALEQKIADLDADIMRNASNSAKLMQLTEEKEETEMALLEKMERWEYLEDLAQKIAAQ